MKNTVFTQKEIREKLKEQKRFRDYYEKNKRSDKSAFSNLHNFILIARYFERYPIKDDNKDTNGKRYMIDSKGVYQL